jgi:Zn-dependent protease
MQPGLELSVFTIAVLIFSVILHEVAHGYAANALGDPTARLKGRLTLNPLPHLDLFGSVIIPGILVLTQAGILFGWAKPVPYNPYNLKNQRWGEAMVGVAGVATNLLIAILFAMVARFAYGVGMGDFANLAEIVVLTNLSLGLFNLIPIPPLDGFTVLRGVLPYKLALPFVEMEQKIQMAGPVAFIAILFLFSQFLSTPFHALIVYTFRLLVG